MVWSVADNISAARQAAAVKNGEQLTAIPAEIEGADDAGKPFPVGPSPRGDLHSRRIAGWSKMRQVRCNLERCGECTPAGRCANHQACVTQRDAALAAEIGAAWAEFVRGQVDVRKPWPPFDV